MLVFGVKRVNFRIFAVLLLALWAVAGFAQETVTFTSNTTIPVGDATYDGKKIVVQNCTVTIDGAHSFAGLEIKGTGVVTHTAGLESGMDVALSGDLVIESTASIDVTAKGYPRNTGPGAGTAAYADGDVGGGGGSYGGAGRWGNRGPYAPAGLTYGSVRSVTQLGSGGGDGRSGTSPGGSGGGLVRFVIGGEARIDGRILAPGGFLGADGGGGSGGGISIEALRITGTGTVVADGRSTNESGGSGGGGRIKMKATVWDFAGKMQAAAGWGETGWAAAGTVYRETPEFPDGDLTIHNLDRDGLGTYIAGDLPLSRLYIDGYGKLIAERGQMKLSITAQTLEIGAKGRIDLTGTGHGSGAGPGAGAPNPGVGHAGGGGASYGGLGREGRFGTYPTWGAFYGSLTSPSEPGSGGGIGGAGEYAGGPGGGAIRIKSQLLKVDGVILADGQLGEGPNGGVGGGGSGGAIWIETGQFMGTGTLSASGAYSWRGGGGGGGRIAVHYGTSSFAGTLKANGNSSEQGYSGAGTVFLKGGLQAFGDLIIDNLNWSGNATPLSGPHTFDNLTVKGRGLLKPSANLEPLNITVIGDCTITGNGSISAFGSGYPEATGPGAGTTNFLGGGGGGGGYGGAGKNGRNGSSSPGGIPYGSAQLPTDFGSAGGNSNHNGGDYRGGWGGGFIRLTVNGVLRVDSEVSVSGQGGWVHGGGSGGSLLLRVGRLEGTGYIRANGGSTNSWGGGGGGGRIAIYYVENGFLGTIEVFGGHSELGQAENGSVHTEKIVSDIDLVVSVASQTMAGGTAGFGTVLLSKVAPLDGLWVSLKSQNPAISVPDAVYVREGETSASFDVVASPVTSGINGSIVARLFDREVGVSVTVLPWVSNLRLTPDSLVSGQTGQGVLTLNLPAPSGGLVVNLTSNDPTVSVPATVEFAPGTTTATFDVVAGTVTQPKQVTLRATYLGETAQALVQVSPAGAQVLSLKASPSSLVGGNQATAVLRLDKPAPAGGVVVTLASSDKATASVPNTVRILPGRNSASFTVRTNPVATSKSVVLSATLGVQKTSTIIVRQTGIHLLELFPDICNSGDTVIGVITLDSVPKAPVVVTILSDNAAATPETTITIPAGQTTGAFLIQANVVASPKSALITVKANGTQRSRVLVIQP